MALVFPHREKPCLWTKNRIKEQLRSLLMRKHFALCLSIAAANTLVYGQSGSPYESSADFAKYAMKLREQAMLKVNNDPQVLVPTTSKPTIPRFPWKSNIVTTVFWVGEQA